ncbi:MAG TPA: hypothetical protein VJY54_03855 [Lachnospiraceae bacterium]|nr:hypothetical protein [Lachnospiraceae bacterium]
MESFIKRYGWNILLLLNIFMISLFSIEVFEIYYNANKISDQTVDALSNISIQFMIDTDSMIDFSFLETETEFAILQRVSDSMPIFQVLFSDNYFMMEEGRNFQKEDFTGEDSIYICGNSASSIMETEPFIYQEQEFREIGIINDANTLASIYGVFL